MRINPLPKRHGWLSWDEREARLYQLGNTDIADMSVQMSMDLEDRIGIAEHEGMEQGYDEGVRNVRDGSEPAMDDLLMAITDAKYDAIRPLVLKLHDAIHGK